MGAARFVGFRSLGDLDEHGQIGLRFWQRARPLRPHGRGAGCAPASSNAPVFSATDGAGSAAFRTATAPQAEAARRASVVLIVRGFYPNQGEVPKAMRIAAVPRRPLAVKGASSTAFAVSALEGGLVWMAAGDVDRTGFLHGFRAIGDRCVAAAEAASEVEGAAIMVPARIRSSKHDLAVHRSVLVMEVLGRSERRLHFASIGGGTASWMAIAMVEHASGPGQAMRRSDCVAGAGWDRRTLPT